MVKIVYSEVNKMKSLHGIIISDVNDFIKLKMPDGTIFAINKNCIVSMRYDGDDGYDKKEQSY